MFKRLLTLLAAATVAASVGCIANNKYGCDNTSLVAAGSPDFRACKSLSSMGL
jgi:hypothetical protein